MRVLLGVKIGLGLRVRFTLEILHSVPIRLAAKASVERGCGETQPQKLLHCRGWCFAHGRAPSELATNRTGMLNSMAFKPRPPTGRAWLKVEGLRYRRSLYFAGTTGIRAGELSSASPGDLPPAGALVGLTYLARIELKSGCPLANPCNLVRNSSIAGRLVFS